MVPFLKDTREVFAESGILVTLMSWWIIPNPGSSNRDRRFARHEQHRAQKAVSINQLQEIPL